MSNLDELHYQLGSEQVILNDYVLKTLKRRSEKDSSESFLKKILRIGRGSSSDSKTEAKEASEPALPEALPVNMKETYILRYDSDGANFLLADCCSPIPGDEVLGFVGDDNRVTVHSLTCPRAAVLKASYGPRIVATRWERVEGKFLAHVRIQGIDRHGILQELTQMISNHLNMDIRRLNIAAEDEVFSCDLWVRVAAATVVEDLCAKLRKVDGVTSAARIY